MTTNQLIVIACGDEKGTEPAPARDLYTSATFRHFLNSAIAEADDTVRVMGGTATVMILSAEHGLVDLDTVVDPYDTKMGGCGHVSVETVAAQLADIAPSTVMAMLPGAYLRTLTLAVEGLNDDDDNEWIELLDVFESPFGCKGGIGHQRGVASSLIRTHGVIAA